MDDQQLLVFHLMMVVSVKVCLDLVLDHDLWLVVVMAVLVHDGSWHMVWQLEREWNDIVTWLEWSSERKRSSLELHDSVFSFFFMRMVS